MLVRKYLLLRTTAHPSSHDSRAIRDCWLAFGSPSLVHALHEPYKYTVPSVYIFRQSVSC